MLASDYNIGVLFFHVALPTVPGYIPVCTKFIKMESKVFVSEREKKLCKKPADNTNLQYQRRYNLF